MDAENMREFKFRVQYELKDGSRVWLYSPTDVSNSHIFDLKNAGHRNRVTDVPEIVDGKRTGNDLVAAIIEESFGQWTGLKDSKGVEIWEGDIVEHEDTYGDNPPEFSKFEVKFAGGSFYLSYMGDEGDDYNCDILIQPITIIGTIHDKEQA